jgi:hypothetical protein
MLTSLHVWRLGLVVNWRGLPLFRGPRDIRVLVVLGEVFVLLRSHAKIGLVIIREGLPLLGSQPEQSSGRHVRKHGAERHSGRGRGEDTAPRNRCAHACGRADWASRFGAGSLLPSSTRWVPHAGWGPHHTFFREGSGFGQPRSAASYKE